MSLSDALLLDPWRDPREVWIAMRSDGQRGSGTQSDPYDGGTRYAQAQNSSLALDKKEVIVATVDPHGFITGNSIVLSGVTGPDATLYNQAHNIEKLTAYSFRLTLSGVPTQAPSLNDNVRSRLSTESDEKSSRLFWPASKLTTTLPHGLVDYDVVSVAGTPDPVFNGEAVVIGATDNRLWYRLYTVPAADATYLGVTCSKVIYRFDEIMRTVPANIRVHLGPGVFKTRGHEPGRPDQSVSQGWTAQPRQKIRGAGLGITTLRLRHATVPFQLTSAIGHDQFIYPYVKSVDGFEASDFTVDCDIRSQIFDRVAKGAVRALGRHVRFQRLRAVDFGTHSAGIECFVFSTAGGDPRTPDPYEGFDCRIEDCVIEQPGLNSLYTMTAMLLASGEEPPGVVMGWHRACALRRTYTDCAYLDNPVSIAAISIAGSVATVTTRKPHGRASGEVAVISGALVNELLANGYNGSYSITVTSPTQFTYEPMPTPAVAPTGDMWLGRAHSQWVEVTRMDRIDGSPANGLIAKLTTATPHFRRPGQTVQVLTGGAIPAPYQPYFGRFLVVDDPAHPVSSTVLYYRMDAVPGEPSLVANNIATGANLQALSGDGGSEALVESNAVFNCRCGGPYHDTWGTRGFITRDNFYSGVVVGAEQTMGGSSWNIYPERKGTLSVSNGIATFTPDALPYGLGLEVGQAVEIRDPDMELVGFFRVQSISATSFTFAYSGSGGMGFRYGALWQVGLGTFERNIIEIEAGALNIGGRIAIANTGRFAHGSESVFRRMLIQKNLIRMLSESPSPTPLAVLLEDAEKTLIAENLLELPSAIPIAINRSQTVELFNNTAPNGTLVENVPGRTNQELSTKIQDALALSML